MFTRKSVLTACGVIAGLVLVAASMKAWDNKTDGPDLQPSGGASGRHNSGTYIFELVDPSMSLDLVRV